MIQSFTVPGRMSSFNEYISECRKNPRAGNRFKQKAQDEVVRCINEAGLKPMKERVHIVVLCVEPNMRRDRGNVRSFAEKVICDALQEAGVIGNDNARWILGDVEFVYRYNAENPRIEVDLEGELA